MASTAATARAPALAGARMLVIPSRASRGSEPFICNWLQRYLPFLPSSPPPVKVFDQ
jgi:hypothetical protein